MTLHKKLKESVKAQVKTRRLKPLEKSKPWPLLPFFLGTRALVKIFGFNIPTITAKYLNLFAKTDGYGIKSINEVKRF